METSKTINQEYISENESWTTGVFTVYCARCDESQEVTVSYEGEDPTAEIAEALTADEFMSHFEREEKWGIIDGAPVCAKSHAEG